MVDLEVVKDDTLAELLSNVAVHTKKTVLPLTTGGLLHCNSDKNQDVHRHIQQLEMYLEKGFKETTESLAKNSPLKKSIEDVLEGPFEDIISEVEMLRTKFQKGEVKETCMKPFGKKLLLNSCAGSMSEVKNVVACLKRIKCSCMLIEN